MSKHTPGPWIFENRSGDHPLNDQDGWGCDGLWAVNGGFILGAGPGWGGDYTPPNDADARLIAASPDLLSVCKELAESAAYWSDYDVPLGIVDRLNAAIAKAEGTA